MFESSDDSDDEYFPATKKRKERVFRPRACLETANFEESFRLSKPVFEDVLRKVGRHLSPVTNRSEALSAEEKLCVTLHYLGTNGFYHLIGSANGPSKSTVCGAVHQTVQAINFEIFQEEVQWPKGEELRQVPRRFFAEAGMPSVAGCIDGTLVKILAPTENEPQFVDRHGDHSINCMVVAGPDYRFYYCSAKWPGSVNDCRVLANSTLCQKFDKEGWTPFPNAVLLGDSIYPVKKWLVPPIPDAICREPQEIAFNKSHKGRCIDYVIKQYFKVHHDGLWSVS